MKSPIPYIWVFYLFVCLLIALIASYIFRWQAGISIIPFLLIICCPLMMLMMGGHGNGKHSSGSKDDDHHQ